MTESAENASGHGVVQLRSGFDLMTESAENASGHGVVKLRSGYDLPVYGLDDGNFYSLHVVALSIISCSLVCAITVVIWSFRSHNSRFFTWSQGERFAVYMAFCDGLFNISHSLDHLHYVIQRNHVTPAGLCVFYAMFLVEFSVSQILLVHITAINAFMLVHRRRALEFGWGDHRLLLVVYGLPAILAVNLAVSGQLGPSGAFCFFDMVLAHPAVYLAVNTVLLLTVVLVNSVLYVLTWRKIRAEAHSIQLSVGRSQLVAASHAAAKNCLLFVIAFVLQWWALGVLPIWQKLAPPPFWFVQLTTTFTNLGGCLNLLVYMRIRRRKPPTPPIAIVGRPFTADNSQPSSNND